MWDLFKSWRTAVAFPRLAVQYAQARSVSDPDHTHPDPGTILSNRVSYAFGKFSVLLVDINHKPNTSLQYIICDILFYNYKDLHLDERINNYSSNTNPK